MADTLEGVKRILTHYDLIPDGVVRHGHVYKVTSSRGTYALKQLPIQNEREFLDIQNIIRSYNVPALPTYTTKYGEPMVRMNQSIYYLSPWIEDQSFNAERKWEALVDRVSWLHRRTSREALAYDRVEVDSEQMSYEWEQHRLALEEFMFHAEHQPYPSPFEQRILLLFHRIMADLEAAWNMNKTLHQSDDNDPSEKRVVLCHGEPKPEHVHFSEMGPYLLNFDHAYWGSPVSDLVSIYQSPELNPRWMIRLYNQYQTVHQLTADEKRLLIAGLMKPEPFERLMKQYRANNKQSELFFLGQLHELSERRQQLQELFNYLEKEISDEANRPLDPSLEETDIKSNQQDENNNVERRGPKNRSDHLEDGEG